jgi:hypothetical protein
MNPRTIPSHRSPIPPKVRHRTLIVVVAIVALVSTSAFAADLHDSSPDIPSDTPEPAAAEAVVPPEPGVAPTAPPAAAAARTPEIHKRRCTVDEMLVPRCGVLWGVAPGAFTDLTPSQALRRFEQTTGRPSDILHSYHRGDQLFPTEDQLAAVRQARKRILFANWKVAWGTTWADVAAGGQNDRIDRLAAHLKRTFHERFFLAIHHEPENDIKPVAGSGMTARDYVAMYRHTVERLRAKGVTNAVFVMVYMAYEPWCVQPWFEQLYPGDDVVDWIGFDPYLYARPGGYGHGDFANLMNRTSNPERWPGFYNWATRTKGHKPLMVAEWGVYEYPSDRSKKAWIFSTVARQLPQFPAIKALVYFDSPAAPKGDTRPDSSTEALTEYRRLAGSTTFQVEMA